MTADRARFATEDGAASKAAFLIVHVLFVILLLSFIKLIDRAVDRLDRILNLDKAIHRAVGYGAAGSCDASGPAAAFIDEGAARLFQFLKLVGHGVSSWLFTDGE